MPGSQCRACASAVIVAARRGFAYTPEPRPTNVGQSPQRSRTTIWAVAALAPGARRTKNVVCWASGENVTTELLAAYVWPFRSTSAPFNVWNRRDWSRFGTLPALDVAEIVTWMRPAPAAAVETLTRGRGEQFGVGG